jgi:hypothetical protein
MDFTTKIPILKYDTPIDYDSNIISIGSCFAENMSDKFTYFKFQNIVNPFGIIFNPVSIENSIKRIVSKQKFTNEDLFFHNDLWHCFEVHSRFSNPNKTVLLEILNQLIESTFNQISNASHFIITYGSSWVYRHSVSKSIVANCHKLPQKEFKKEILAVETIEKSIQNTIRLIQKVNPNCQFVFTVSPVRHLKDGFIENQRSKAHLITAIHNLQQVLINTNYFPSYEITMDELRDYRFYAEDMLHPNQTAIDYIWLRFFENYVLEAIIPTMHKVCEIQRALQHRAIHLNSASHQIFLNALQIKIDKIQNEFPSIKF